MRRISFKTLVLAVRPFAFPASVIPVCLGTALAWEIGKVEVRFELFALALLGIMALHAGANILSDIQDYHRGLDKHPTPVSGALVRGLMTSREAMAEAGILLLFGVAVGLWIAWQTTPVILAIGAMGVLLGVSYTWPPLCLKYRALGDVAVLLVFGVLGTLGAWTVQMGKVSWCPVIHSVPAGLLIVAILHANNWRDISSDSAAGVRTIASILGDWGSLVYYLALICAPFLWVLGLQFVVWDSSCRLPSSVLLVLLAVPAAVRCVQRAIQRHLPSRTMEFVTLDATTAQLSMWFGLLYVLGILWPKVSTWWK